MALSHNNQFPESLSRELSGVADACSSPLSEISAPSGEKTDFFRSMVKKLGFNSALLSGALGLGALENLVAPSVARGEIITFFGTQEAAKARGAEQTAQFGGNAVYIRADYNFPGFGPITDYFSGFLVNETRVATAAHGFSSIAQYNPTFSVGLSADYKTPTIEIPILSYEYHPSYQGGVGGTGYDLARGELAFAAPNVSEVNFWSGAKPPVGTDILKIGYGLSGTPAGYDFSDQGAARGVFSSLIDLNPSLGDPSKYVVSEVDPTRADGGRSAPKDSGGPGLIFNPNLNQWETAFMQIGGSSSPASPFSQHLHLDSEARNFLVTSVPEPSSVVLTGAALATLLFSRRKILSGVKKTKAPTGPSL